MTIQRYVHIGTGNYNRATAQVYTDFGLFTANPRIAADASELFNYLTGYSKQTSYRELSSRPWRCAIADGADRARDRTSARRPAGRHHHQEQRHLGPRHHSRCSTRVAGRRPDPRNRARHLLPAAGHCGRQRDHRGPLDCRAAISSTRASTTSKTARNPSVYLGSADLMERNLDRRVESALPRARSRHRAFHPPTVLEAYLTDTERASILQCGRLTCRVPTAGQVPVDAQQLLTRLGMSRYMSHTSSFFRCSPSAPHSSHRAPPGLDPAAACFWMPTTPIRIRSDGATGPIVPLPRGCPLRSSRTWSGVRPAAGDPAHSIVSHGEPFTGREPTLRDFFERIRPLVTRALVDGLDDRWPLITLNLDFKDSHPEHFAAIWASLGDYEAWLTTARKSADEKRCSRSTSRPVLVLTGADPAQRLIFHEPLPVGSRLRLFGAVPAGAAKATNYLRWSNNPWNVVEPEGQNTAGDWSDCRPNPSARSRDPRA